MIIYVSKDGNVKVDVNVQNEDIWMSQDVMVETYNFSFGDFILLH